MAFISPFIMANKNGIPRLESTGVTVGTTNVRFSFRNHPFLSAPFSGLILFLNLCNSLSLMVNLLKWWLI